MKPPSGQGVRLAYLLLSLASLCLPTPLWKDRDSLMQEEKAHQTGGNLVLSRQEQQLSTKLVNLKKKEVEAAITTGQFPPSMHFFRAKSLIDQSTVFSVLKRMPKGRLGLRSLTLLILSHLLLSELGQNTRRGRQAYESCKLCSRGSRKSPDSELRDEAGGERKRGMDWMNTHFQQLWLLV